LSLALAIPVALTTIFGCEQPPPGGVEVAERDAVRGTNGFRCHNGLQLQGGLSVGTGLNQPSTLNASSPMMSTTDGRNEIAYVVKCALPSGKTIVKYDSAGTKHTFPGLLGFAPEWETGACGQNCQEWVSACLLSLINTSGIHVPVWMMADYAGVGFGQNPAYPKQEGAFFGNIFLPRPQAFYCAGRDYLNNPVDGRIGSRTAETFYSDAYGSAGTCAGHCTPSDYPFNSDGFKACSGWNHVVTIWRE